MTKEKKLNNGRVYLVISLLAVLLIAGSAVAYTVSQNINVEGDYNNYEAPSALEEVNLGGSGTEHYQMNNFYDGAMVGNSTSTIATTTSVGDLLLTAQQICNYNWINLHTFTTDAAFTLTLPTATLLNADCFRGSGMSKAVDLYIENNSGQNATITAGTGGELLEGDGLNVVIATARFVKLGIIMNAGGDRYILSSVELQAGD